MLSISKIPDIDIFGIGVVMDEGSVQASESSFLNIQSINLFSKKLRFLPTFIRHILTIIELSIKMFLIACKIRPDIIHSHDVVALPLAVLLKILFRSKLIYDAHELESNKNGLSESLGRATFITEKFLWSFVNFLITVSPSIDKWYQNNLGPKSSEIILNSPAISTDCKNDDASNKRYLRSKYNIPDDCKIFIYVGILGKGRGIEIFLDIFSDIKNAHLVFMGYGELSNLIDDQTKIFNNIHLHQAAKHDQVVNIIKSADVGLCLIENVSLSDYYCLPNKLFEYCFAGVPIIASNFPDISEIVRRFGLGVCCDENVSVILDTVNGYINGDFAFKLELSSMADLGWDAQQDKLTELYSDIVSKIREAA
jgi:glycosyltransferase involved in cell wall biosynthesis